MAALPNNEIPDVRQDTIKRDSAFMVFDGSHKLSPKEHKFISCYMTHFDEGRAAEEAGYSVRPSVKNTKAYFKGKGKGLLAKDYIQKEINHRLEEIQSHSVADANEIMQYFTSVMRGEVSDQFGLDAPLAERTNAAKELAKRLIDLPSKNNQDNEVHVVIERKPREKKDE